MMQQLTLEFDHAAAPLKVIPKTSTGMIPRPYQLEAVESAFKLWDSGVPGVMCRLPTGTGKSLVAALLAEQWIARGDSHYVMIIAHERQLVHQFAGEILQAINVRPGIEMGVEKVSEWSLPRVVVGSRASLLLRTKSDEESREVSVSRLFKFDPALNWLVVWDEAHLHVASLRSVKNIVEHFEQNPNSRRCGITATPMRTDKRTLKKMFPGIAIDYRLCSIDPEERNAVDDGYAVAYDQRYIKVTSVDFKAIREIAGDFDQDELARLLTEQETLASLCNPLIDLVGDRRTVIFNVNVTMAKQVCHFLNAYYSMSSTNGTSAQRMEVAAWLDGECNDVERRKVFHKYQTGQIQFLSVCGLCRVGWNSPETQCVAIFRPTKSLPLKEQMLGRGCRPLKGTIDGLDTAEERKRAIAMSAKATTLIVDLVGCTGLGECASTAKIYSQGLPDEVLLRSQKKVLDGETDWKKAINDSKNEIAREAKANEERKAKVKAAKLARAQANVQYTQTQVNGQMAARSNVRGFSSGYRMPFGKFQGQPMGSLPAGYLAWMQAEIKSGSVRRFAEMEINHRISRGDDAMIRAVQRFAHSKETV